MNIYIYNIIYKVYISSHHIILCVYIYMYIYIYMKATPSLQNERIKQTLHVDCCIYMAFQKTNSRVLGLWRKQLRMDKQTVLRILYIVEL